MLLQEPNPLQFAPEPWSWLKGVAILLGVIGCCLVVWGIHTANLPDAQRRAKEGQFRMVVALWTVGVPVWFAVENSLMPHVALAWLRANYDWFKYTQELARNVWLAMAAVLVAMWLRKLPGGVTP